MSERFTIVPHEPLDSEAGRLLSAGAFRVHIDGWRRWMAETQNGKRDATGIALTWTACLWPVTRLSWRRYRDELLAKGFWEPVNAKSGLYRPSEGWRTYSPNADESAKLTVHRGAKERRAKQQAEFIHRGQKMTPVQGSKNDPCTAHGQRDGYPQGSKNDPCTGLVPQGSKNDPCTGVKNRPLTNTNTMVGGGGECRRGNRPASASQPEPVANVFQRIKELTVPDDVAASMDAATAEGDAETRAVLRGASMVLRRLDTAWQKLEPSARLSDGPALIARALGDDKPRAVRHVAAIVERYGPEAVLSAARSILSAPEGIRSPLGVLEVRAASQAEGAA